MPYSQGMNKDERREASLEGREHLAESGPASPEVTETKDTNWSLIIRLTGAAVVATLFVLFIVQNAESVEIDFLATSFSLPRSVLMLASASVGVVLWELAGFVSRRVRKRDS